IIALNGVDEFMMLVKPKDVHRDVDPDEIGGWVKRSIGADIPVHIVGYYPWNAGQALVAERYKAGRIMIAGDAAHLFTPTGGFGVETRPPRRSHPAWELAPVPPRWRRPDPPGTA